MLQAPHHIWFKEYWKVLCYLPHDFHCHLCPREAMVGLFYLAKPAMPNDSQELTMVPEDCLLAGAGTLQHCITLTRKAIHPKKEHQLRMLAEKNKQTNKRTKQQIRNKNKTKQKIQSKNQYPKTTATNCQPPEALFGSLKKSPPRTSCTCGQKPSCSHPLIYCSFKLPLNGSLCH